MKKMLTENWSIKLAAVLLAIVLWMIVVNINNPLRTSKFTVDVTLRNATTVTDAGMIYDILENSNQVTVTVKAPRSVLEEMEASDLLVIADFNNITNMNTIPLQVSAKRFASRIELMTLNHTNLLVNLEEAKTKEFNVVLETTGDPASGYTVDYTSVTPNLITVTGPVRLIDAIDRVVASVSVENRSTTMRTNAKLKLYKADGTEISDSRISFSNKNILTNVTFLNTKTVDIKAKASGECAPGYRLADVVCSPTTLTVAGTKSALLSIDTIEIPAEELNIDGAQKDVVREVDVTPYLPEGIQMPKDGDPVIKITAKIEELEERQLTIPTASINLVNTPENMRASFGDIDSIQIMISGAPEDLDHVSQGNVKASVDLKGLGEGVNRVDVDVTTPEGIRIAGTTWVDVILESTQP